MTLIFETRKAINKHFFVLLAFGGLLFGCSPQEKYPEAYGIYAWNGSTWVEIGKDSATIKIDLTPESRFLLHDKAVDQLSKNFSIIQKVYIRNDIAQDRDGSNKAIERNFNKWDVKDQSETVDGKLFPVRGQPEMVNWKPVKPLVNGVYQPMIRGEQQEAFIVDRKSVLAGDITLTDFCFDRLNTRKFMWENPIPAQYVSCAGDPNEQLLKVFQNNRRLIDIKEVERLLARGANPNLNDEYNAATILQTAVTNGRADIASLLISRGAKVDQPSSGSSHETALFHAYDKDTVDTLLRGGADVKFLDADGRTVLHRQNMRIEPQLVEHFISKGAPLGVKDKFGRTSLDEAKITYETLRKNKESGILSGEAGEKDVRDAAEVINILSKRS